MYTQSTLNKCSRKSEFSTLRIPWHHQVNNTMLALELWSTICYHLDRSDLANLARTSSQLLAAARPVLYQSVHLRSDRRGGTQATFNLLNSDPSLTKKITDIHVFTAWQKDGEAKAWLDLSVISKLTQLRSMTMIASPFKDAEEQKTFLKILNESCSSLREFTYRQDFRIAGIERLIWDDQDDRSPSHTLRT
ncbi:hypothetical protein BDZ94DRAFT_992815 [Collybia nuda]|uniref:F-box domain-containing protein n=1 Tax=Collybia nuda TaxID=64659 RepID=A0A9P6CG99_9AGAR|nr:hypothetical protein BDZ94DRAFT_992815 [Collybia nuda]